MILGNYTSIILRHRAYLVTRFADRSVISSFRRASTLTQPSHPRESIDSVTTFRISKCIAVDFDSINCWPKPRRYVVSKATEKTRTQNHSCPGLEQNCGFHSLLRLPSIPSLSKNDTGKFIA